MLDSTLPTEVGSSVALRYMGDECSGSSPVAAGVACRLPPSMSYMVRDGVRVISSVRALATSKTHLGTL